MPTSGGGLLAAIRARLRNVAFGYDFFISYRSAGQVELRALVACGA
jgi:hypothetical protein